MNIKRLETEHLVLRKAKLKDLDKIWHNVWSDKRLACNMLWEVVKDEDKALDRLNRTIKYQSENTAYFVCLKETDEPIGFAGVYERSKGIYEESGICIAYQYQGMGYGKEVLKALKYLVFELLHGDVFLYGCFSTNEISKRLCLSQGFKYHSSYPKVREHDNKKFICDYYYYDYKMYMNN